MLKLSTLKTISGLMMFIVFNGCQSMTEHVGTHVIAGGFSTSTHVQRFALNLKSAANIQLIDDIAYGNAPRQRLDIYLPKTSPTQAVIVWVHGGGWISGNKNDAKGYYIRLAEQGYAVVALNYRLAPETQFPAQLQDIDQALAFLQREGPQWQLPMQQVFLAGDSAGANMVSHYTAFVTDAHFVAQSLATPIFKAVQFRPTLHPSQLKGLLLHCGIYDLANFAKAKQQQWRLLNWGVAELTDAYMPMPVVPEHRAAQLRQHSPQSANLSQFPPVLISGGHLDFLTESQSVPFRNQLRSQGVDVRDVLYRKGQSKSKGLLLHEFQFNLSLDAAQEVFQESLLFLARHR